MQSIRLSAPFPTLPTGHRRGHYQTGQSFVLLSRQGPRKEEPPLTAGRFDDLATCRFEGFGVREG